MAAVKTKLGRIPCDHCGQPTMLKRNERNTLTMQCDDCGKSSFAKVGENCHKDWLAALPKEPAKEPEPAPVAQAPESVPKAAPPKKAGPFDFLGLGA
jgi:hypothetical protein